MVMIPSSNQLFFKGLIITIFTLGSGFSGLLPQFELSSQKVTVYWNTKVLAQSQSDFTAEEITNYARAAIALEARRYQVVNEIKKIVGEVPHIVCDEPRTIQALPGNIPQIAVNYCDQARQMIERHHLTVTRFNEMTRKQQSTPQFREQIQAEILRLLQSSEAEK